MSPITKGKSNENKSISTKLPLLDQDEINKLVDAGAFLSVSDFVREAIREKLESYKIINIRNVDYKTAKKEILGYYKIHKEAYISDVADDLEFDLELVVNITNELIKEGRLGDIED
ncbi:ribbon-helix-helix domain-containing protein [Methanobrevibacter sp. DSM 116169]|uniref:ribbon-helix-helix domain-containing protein n=1 Tax=Methanobrevibacter sp. DSM 116169 TaxID=3242727 RepID=UPI0038FC21A1